jgi:hypothetical protein
MRLDKFLAEILASIDPTLRPLMQPDGTFVVVLNKALYGCIESAPPVVQGAARSARGDRLRCQPIRPVRLHPREGRPHLHYRVLRRRPMLIGHCEEAVDFVGDSRPLMGLTRRGC